METEKNAAPETEAEASAAPETEAEADAAPESEAETDAEASDTPESEAEADDTPEGEAEASAAPEGEATSEELQIEADEESTLLDNVPQRDLAASEVKKKKSSLLMLLIRTVIALAVIAVGIYIILYLVARAAKYDSIAAMLDSMFVELGLMWQRIIY